MALSNPITQCYGTSAIAVSKSDTAAFPPSIIYVGGAGVVNVTPADQAGAASPAQVLFTVPAGGVVPCMCIQVFNTSTTATLLVRVA